MKKRNNPIRLTLSYVLLVMIAIVSIYPVLWIFLSSLRPGAALFSERLWPESFTLSHYGELFNNPSFMYGRWYMNTLKIAFFTMIFYINGDAGHVRVIPVPFSGRKTILSTMLILGMFPSFMSMIAIYIILLQIKLLDTHVALILVYSSGAVLGGFIVKGFFDTIPRSLDEAARIDGASHLRVFTSIILPLSKPMLTYVALTSFTGHGWILFCPAGAANQGELDSGCGDVGSREPVSGQQLHDVCCGSRTDCHSNYAAVCVLATVPCSGSDNRSVQRLTSLYGFHR